MGCEGREPTMIFLAIEDSVVFLIEESVDKEYHTLCSNFLCFRSGRRACLLFPFDLQSSSIVPINIASRNLFL